MGELDGRLILNTGRGLEWLDARQACNVAVAVLLEGVDEAGREKFWQDLEVPLGPSAETVRMMEEYRQARQAAP